MKFHSPIHHPPKERFLGFSGILPISSAPIQRRGTIRATAALRIPAAIHVNLVPNEQLGIVVLTNAYPLGIAEALGTTFLDLALYGKPTQDWLVLFKQAFF
jgi:hypothetical protein